MRGHLLLTTSVVTAERVGVEWHEEWCMKPAVIACLDWFIVSGSQIIRFGKLISRVPDYVAIKKRQRQSSYFKKQRKCMRGFLRIVSNFLWIRNCFKGNLHCTGWARLIRSHSSARFSFELSGNSNYIIHCNSNYVQNFELEINSI